MKHILFVCTGNTCRSPLAEAILRNMAAKRQLPVEVRSAGVSAANGLPISRHSATLLHHKQIEFEHTSTALSDRDIEWADLILTMTVGHKQAVIQRYPEALEKVFTLKEFASDDGGTSALIEEREKLFSEIQLKQALNQPVTDEERQRAFELDRLIPDFDISDPFGGSYEHYRACAEEIEQCLHKLLTKIAL